MRPTTHTERLAAWFRPRDPGERRRWAGILLDPRRFAGAQALVSAFYAVLLFLAVAQIFLWRGDLGATALEPRWAVAWLRWVDTRLGIGFILWFHLAANLLGMVLSGHRWVRVLVLVSWLEFLSFRFSFGAINHGEHLGLLLAFVLIFLPAGWSSRVAKKGVRAATLRVFAACQALILLTYSMSGWWKVGGVAEQLLRGEVSYLAPSALARQVAAKLLADHQPSLLGPWLIEHAWVGWPLMLAALYLEACSLWIVARPSLHRPWGFGLILLHVSTHLAMGIGFPQNVLWLGLFLMLSPFQPATWSWRVMLRDLPLLRK